MYATSQVTWDRSGGAVEVSQETSYPQTDTVRVTVRKAGNGRFTMKLRIPAWAKGATMAVNGQQQAVKPGPLAAVSPTWKAGDTIDLVITQTLRTPSIADQNPQHAPANPCYTNT